jgi:hypothetical protein
MPRDEVVGYLESLINLQMMVGVYLIARGR